MKGQGLPLNFIVLAALAILILVLAAAFIMAGRGSIARTMGPAEVRNTCLGYCQTLQNQVAYMDSSAATQTVTNSDYCQKTFALSTGATDVHCYDTKIGASCIITFGDGSSELVDEAKCTGTGQ